MVKKMETLDIQICQSIEEAPRYTAEDGWYSAQLKNAVIVKNGTVAGNPTLDLCFVDEEGRKYIAMVTSNIFNGLASALKGAMPEGKQ